LKTYLFDFDGTLVDSMPVFASVVLRLLDENGMDYESDIIKTITPLGYAGAADYFISMGMQLPKEEILRRLNAYARDAYENKIPAKKNVVSVLRRLKALGANLNVLTASSHIMLDPCLKRLGIYDLFTNVWSCEDFGTTKADPEIYVLAAQRIGERVEDILFLDDNYNADKTAKSAGMKVCGVYDDSSREFAEEIKSVADYYIDDFAQLFSLE